MFSTNLPHKSPANVCSSVSRLSLMVALLAGLHSSQTVIAASVYWRDVAGNYNGDFQDINHWSATQGGVGGEPVPDASDIATFDNNQVSPYAVSLTSDLTVGGFQVDTDNVTLDVGTSTMTLPSSTGVFRIGGAGETAVFNLTSSAGSGQGQIYNSSGTTEIGIGANANGTMIVDGGATFFRTGSGGIQVGGGTDSQANLQIIDGTVRFQGSSASFGNGGNSTVDVTVNSQGRLETHGYVNLTSAGTHDLTIDIDGGTWSHEHAGRGITIGTEAGGQGPSTVNMTIQNGGTMTNVHDFGQDGGRPERALGKDISILITDAGSSMRSRSHYIGGGTVGPVESTHEVTVANSAILGVSQTLKIWAASDTNSAPDGNFGDDGLLILDNGIVEIDGTDSTPGNLDVRGILRGNGTIRRRAGSGSDLITADVSGIMRPGDVTSLASAGVLTFEDATLDVSGTLKLDIASDSVFDQINVTGNGSSLNVSGIMDIDFLDGYEPEVDQTFNLLFAENISYTGTSNLDLFPKRYSLRVVQNFIGSTDVLQLSIMPIPEPSTLGLMSFASVLLMRRRKRSYSK